MADGIHIRIDDGKTRELLKRLAGRIKDLRPALKAIGEHLVKSTDRRFEAQGPAPDGTPWAPLEESTLARKRRKGRIMKILQERGHLRGSIRAQLLGKTAVAVGTNRVYAAAQQFGADITQAARSEIFQRNRYVRGGKKGRFKKGTISGRGFTFGERRIHIPARPFLGVDAQDSGVIAGIIDRYLAES